MDLELADMFGKPPRTVMQDKTLNTIYQEDLTLIRLTCQHTWKV